MRTRERGYKIDFDYYGIGAIGDVRYDDGFDRWDDIQMVMKGKRDLGQSIPIKKTHNSKEPIGDLKYWELDKCNKKVYVGFNNDDIDGKLDTFNNVSPQWIIDERGRIVDIDHFAIGNSFKQKCDDGVCGIKAVNRGEEPVAEVPEEPKEPTITELQAQIKELRAQLTKLSSSEEEDDDSQEADDGESDDNADTTEEEPEKEEEDEKEEEEEAQKPKKKPKKKSKKKEEEKKLLKLGFRKEVKTDNTKSSPITVFRKMEYLNLKKM